jgi:THO complex subunit 1
VNLRGEYHTENVTSFDALPQKEQEGDQMDVDSDDRAKPKLGANGTTEKASEESQTSTKGVTFSKPETPLSADGLYPIFWSLQEVFNQPKKLFDPVNFAGFKAGLGSTMAMFKSVQNDAPARSVKTIEDGKRGTKRKRSQADDDLANAFNPKYLTSRDLFELEVCPGKNCLERYH